MNSSAGPSLTKEQHAAHDALLSALREETACSSAELSELAEDFADLRHAISKLQAGRFEVVLLGEIDTGKSALANALVGANVASVDVRGGWTREVWTIPWTDIDATGGSVRQVVLLDSPGLNEVQGAARTKLAARAARLADLVVFVADSDLNQSEFAVLAQLAAAHKPVLFVLNKCDLYTQQELNRLVSVLRDDRLSAMVGSDDFLQTSADPREQEYVFTLHGQEQSDFRKPPPDAAALRERVRKIIQSEGAQLLAMTGSLSAADIRDKIVATRVRLREQRANEIIWAFALTKAAGVAAAPVLVDIVGGVLADAGLVAALAKHFGQPMSQRQASGLLWTIAQACGWVAVADGATKLAAALFKGMTLHGGVLLTAVPQGVAAGYGAYIVGQASKVYFENGASWGPEGAKHVIRRILDSTDRESILQRFREELLLRLDRNVHSQGAPNRGWFRWRRE